MLSTHLFTTPMLSTHLVDTYRRHAWEKSRLPCAVERADAGADADADGLCTDCPLAAQISCTFRPTSFSSVHAYCAWQVFIFPAVCVGRRDGLPPFGWGQSITDSTSK